MEWRSKWGAVGSWNPTSMLSNVDAATTSVTSAITSEKRSPLSVYHCSEAATTVVRSNPPKQEEGVTYGEAPADCKTTFRTAQG